MSARAWSLGSTVFFEAQLLFMHEGPHRSIVHLQPTFGELGHEPAQGEVGMRDAFPQPVDMRTLQNARLMTAHLSRRDAARRPKSLRPFHHAGRADAQRCCHWKTMTFLAALRHDRIDAPWVFDGPINAESFRLYVEEVLVAALKPGDIVVLDNLGSHKGKTIRDVIRAAGARRFFLPAYSPA